MFVGSMKRSRDNELFTKTDIMNIIREIREFKGNEKQKRDVFEKKYYEFALSHPHLFKMSCEDTFDMQRLEYMLALKESIDKKEVTFEDASKHFGQMMYDVYIKDKIPSAPPSDK